MLRVTVVLVLVFLALLVARVLRMWLATLLTRRRVPSVEGEMVRDPICGVWIDRRLAIPAKASPRPVSVCSEECLRALERKAVP